MRSPYRDLFHKIILDWFCYFRNVIINFFIKKYILILFAIADLSEYVVIGVHGSNTQDNFGHTFSLL